MDITKLSVQELKSLAYDKLALLQQCESDLRAINTEIANRGQATEKEEVKESEVVEAEVVEEKE
jgi:hypothetical protein